MLDIPRRRQGPVGKPIGPTTGCTGIASVCPDDNGNRGWRTFPRQQTPAGGQFLPGSTPGGAGGFPAEHLQSVQTVFALQGLNEVCASRWISAMQQCPSTGATADPKSSRLDERRVGSLDNGQGRSLYLASKLLNARVRVQRSHLSILRGRIPPQEYRT